MIPGLVSAYAHRERALLMGALSDPGDATALAEGIRTLVDSPGLRTETAESGHERAADFSLGSITDAYLRLYNR
ncbi:glycosyltransferase [Salinirussus salinus]|uniref:glycosyltransferase n=1 Tax=Salinirussus salinus TaxID=1198300 RepID=UPI00135C2208|nr:hypothetical protein [Salinirussus salinus]